MQELRKVIITEGTNRIEGYFHKWGKTLQYDNRDKAHTTTIAIVELKDGTIKIADPKHIMFEYW